MLFSCQVATQHISYDEPITCYQDDFAQSIAELARSHLWVRGMKRITLIHTVRGMLDVLGPMILEAFGHKVTVSNIFDESFAAVDTVQAPAELEWWRLNRLYMLLKASEPVTDAAIVACSTLSVEVQLIKRFFHFPVLAIDDGMILDVVRSGQPLALFATSSNPVKPVLTRIADVARELGAQTPKVTVALCDRALVHLIQNDMETFTQEVLRYFDTFESKASVIVLAQGSTAFLKDKIAQKTGAKVVSSLEYCIADLKRALAGLEGESTDR